MISSGERRRVGLRFLRSNGREGRACPPRIPINEAARHVWGGRSTRIVPPAARVTQELAGLWGAKTRSASQKCDMHVSLQKPLAKRRAFHAGMRCPEWRARCKGYKRTGPTIPRHFADRTPGTPSTLEPVQPGAGCLAAATTLFETGGDWAKSCIPPVRAPMTEQHESASMPTWQTADLPSRKHRYNRADDRSGVSCDYRLFACDSCDAGCPAEACLKHSWCAVTTLPVALEVNVARRLLGVFVEALPGENFSQPIDHGRIATQQDMRIVGRR